MALKWVEGFEEFGTTNGNTFVGLDAKYAVVTTGAARVRDGRLGGKCMSSEPSTGVRISTPNLGNMATVITGFAFQTSILTATRLIGLLEDDAATDGVNLRLTASGALEVYRGNTLLDTSGTTPISTNTWYYLELKVVVANSGSWAVRINGVPFMSDSDDTQAGATNAYANRVRILAADIGSGAFRWDDWYVCDDTGGSNNDFIGDAKVDTIFPNGDDAVDFTPSTGSDNYALVDDNPLDSDSTYVESAVTNDEDIYNLQTPAFVGQFQGIQTNAVCRKTDVTNFDINLVLDSGATVDVGPAITISSTSYGTAHRIDEVDPDTSLEWDLSGLTNLKAGYRVG